MLTKIEFLDIKKKLNKITLSISVFSENLKVSQLN